MSDYDLIEEEFQERAKNAFKEVHSFKLGGGLTVAKVEHKDIVVEKPKFKTIIDDIKVVIKKHDKTTKEVPVKNKPPELW